MRRHISSFSLSSFLLVLSLPSDQRTTCICVCLCVCMYMLRICTQGGFVGSHTPVVYTNDLSKQAHTERKADGEEATVWRRVNERRTRHERNDRLEENQWLVWVVTRQQAGAIRWGPSKFQKRTRAPFAMRIKGSNRDSFGQCRYDRRTCSSSNGVRKY